MSKLIDVAIPDIGDFDQVEVIEVLVTTGDQVIKGDSLITLESDKATMEVPSPVSGIVKEVRLAVGNKVSKGTDLLQMEVDPILSKETPKQKSTTSALVHTDHEIHTEVVVLGAGPGGYTAAFRAADLGKKIVLIERYPDLGGVCLNVGCIPSKALLHLARVLEETQEMKGHGLEFSAPNIDIAKILIWKNGIVKRLTGGLGGLAKQRKVQVVTGKGSFQAPNRILVEGSEGKILVHFEQAIIAAGSQAVKIPGIPHNDPRIWDSTDALALSSLPKRLLVVGGGIIGLEMATVYHALGSQITVVEFMDGLVPGCDRDLVRPLQKRLEARYENIFLRAKVTHIEPTKAGLVVDFQGEKIPESDTFDGVLIAVGRRPNGNFLGLEYAGVQIDERGFIPVDKQQRTNVASIYAIGDVVGNPMLAHKAVHEGKVAAEVIAGLSAAFDPIAIPSVAYTDPEIAWMGLTESQAKEQGIAVEKGSFPWAASGRSLSLGRSEGLTKLLFDASTKRIVGAGIVGPNAGELIAETVLALEMGADIEDISLTIHPHPTLSETIGFAAEIAEGTITDLYMPKNRKPT